MAKTTTYKTVAGLYKALSRLPKEASVQLRLASLEIATKVASEAASRAKSQGGLAKLVAPTIRARRDRTPEVRMGSARRLPTEGNGWKRSRKGPGQTVGDIIWGAEFGAAAYRQFKPWRGNDSEAGYFLYPAVRAKSDMIEREYSAALLDALNSIR